MTVFLKEYLGEFSPLRIRRRIKSQALNARFLYQPLPLLICQLPLVFNRATNLKIFLSVCIPGLLVWYSIILHAPEREKFFYLLPLSQEALRKKIRGDYRKRVCLHMIFFLAGLGFMTFCGFMTVQSFILILLNDFIAATLLPCAPEESGYAINLVLTVAYVFCMYSQMYLLMRPGCAIWADILLYCCFAVIVLPTYIHDQKIISGKLREASECYRGNAL